MTLLDSSFDTTLVRQFIILCKRNWLEVLRNPGIVWIRVAMCVRCRRNRAPAHTRTTRRYTMLCFMIGAMFFDIGSTAETVLERLSMLYYVQAFLCFMAIVATPFFMEQRSTYLRESANRHYAPLPYTLANLVLSIPGIALIALVSSCLVYFMAGLNDVRRTRMGDYTRLFPRSAQPRRAAGVRSVRRVCRRPLPLVTRIRIHGLVCEVRAQRQDGPVPVDAPPCRPARLPLLLSWQWLVRAARGAS